MKLNHVTTAVVLSAASFGVFAQAKAPEADYTLSFNAALSSDYRYRGISQSRLKPAVSAGADFAHKNGFYLGAWGSSIKWIKDIDGDAAMELDIYGGYKGAVTQAISFDVGALSYLYPSHKLAVSPNTTEIYGALSMGPVTAKYSYSTTNLFGNANSKGSGYLDLSATFDLGGGWSVVPHIGRQTISKSSVGNYTDCSLAVNKDVGSGIVVTAALVGTNAQKDFYSLNPTGKFLGKDGLVLTAKYSF